MREIKFRAWTKKKEMQYNVVPFQWDYVIDRMWHKCIESNGNGILGSGGTEAKFEVGGYAIEEGNIMQFTGLKDKNGNEIWEGDICRAMQGEQQKPESFYSTKSKVAFWRGSFEFFAKPLCDVNTDNNGYAKSIMWCWHGHNNLPDIYEEINNIEVIGNIYENPELLK